MAGAKWDDRADRGSHGSHSDVRLPWTGAGRPRVVSFGLLAFLPWHMPRCPVCARQLFPHSLTRLPAAWPTRLPRSAPLQWALCAGVWSEGQACCWGWRALALLPPLPTASAQLLRLPWARAVQRGCGRGHPVPLPRAPRVRDSRGFHLAVGVAGVSLSLSGRGGRRAASPGSGS